MTLSRCYPHLCGKPVFHGNEEALAWCLYQIGNYISYIAVGVFLGTALLKLAIEGAGCSTEPLPGTHSIPDCDKRVYGIKPSSLLTTYAIILSLTSALVMPLIGAIVDFTPHRRLVGRICAFSYCLLLIPQIFANKNTWFAVAFIQFIGSLIGWFNNVAAYAYLPELSDVESVLNGYIRTFVVLSFLSMAIFLGATVAIASALGIDDNDIKTSELGMSIAFVLTTIALGLAWGVLFKRRDAAHPVPTGQSLWRAGFVHLYQTTRIIIRERTALKWFYLSIAMSDAGVLSLASVVVTFFTDQLNMSASENGIAVLILLASSAPGAYLAEWCNTKFNPIRSSIAALLLVVVVTIVAAAILREPGQQVASYLCAVGWGTAIGWKWTCDALIASTIIPKGQEGELMGVYQAASQLLSWLPPLIYTLLNEAGVSQRIGLGTLSVFWSMALLCLVRFGRYEDAVEAVRSVPPPVDKPQGDVDAINLENSQISDFLEKEDLSAKE